MASRRLRDQLTNLPNLLTYGRIASIPVIMWLVQRDSAANCFWAAVVYTVAAITDMLDGFLARIFGQVSMVGKFLDPLADKLMAILLLLALLPMGRVPVWAVAVIVTRELSITGLRAIAAGEGLIISASDSAKIKTAFQLVGNIALLLHYVYSLDLIFWSVKMDFHAVGMMFLYVSMIVSVYSALLYFKGFYDALLSDQRQ